MSQFSIAPHPIIFFDRFLDPDFSQLLPPSFLAPRLVIPDHEAYEFTQAKSLPMLEWSDAGFAIAKEFFRIHFGLRVLEL